MRIGVLGINHKSADLSFREKVAKACYKRLNIESVCAEELSCVLLLTCHRTEIYFSSEDLAEAHSILLNILREEIIIPFEHKLYAYFGVDCFAHLAQVTAGLDSMIIAESEIQRQVKQAYEQTCLHYSLSSAMHYLFQKSLHLGKYLRSGDAFPQGQISIPKMIYALCLHVYGDVRNQKILIVGNSQINRKVLSYLKHKSVVHMALCTRSILSAQEMTRELRLQILDWSQLAQWGQYDIVICGTNAASFLIQPMEQESRTRLIFDLGVPRNVDPKLGRHPSIALFNIDKLGEMMQQRQKTYEGEILQSQTLIQNKVNYYVAAFQEKAEAGRLTMEV